MKRAENIKSICFVSPYGFPLLVPNGKGSGGAERQLYFFGKGLADQGWRVSFITDQPKADYKDLETNLPVYPCSFSYLGGNNLRIFFDWLSLLWAMNKADSKYYVLKVPGHLLSPMALFCKVFNRRLVFWNQSNYESDPVKHGARLADRLLHTFGIINTDCIIAQTTEQKDNFKLNHNINAFVIPSICAITSTKKAKENPRNHQVKVQPIDVLWIGNSTPNKRYEVVIELAKLIPHIHFTIAMNIADLNRYKEAELQCHSIPNIEFLGMVPPIQIERIFPHSKLFLNTSSREGFPNTYLQSWMNAVPTVSLNIDPDNIIKNQNLGLVISDNSLSTNIDYHSLATMLVKPIIKLLMEHDVRETMGENAKQYVSEKHDASIVLNKLEEALLKIN